MAKSRLHTDPGRNFYERCSDLIFVICPRIFLESPRASDCSKPSTTPPTCRSGCSSEAGMAPVVVATSSLRDGAPQHQTALSDRTTHRTVERVGPVSNWPSSRVRDAHPRVVVPLTSAAICHLASAASPRHCCRVSAGPAPRPIAGDN